MELHIVVVSTVGGELCSVNAGACGIRCGFAFPYRFDSIDFLVLISCRSRTVWLAATAQV